MASPPFVIQETKPADADIVSQHPTDERSMRDNVESWHDFEHGAASGRHKIPKGTVAARDAITDWEAGSLWINMDTTPDTLQMNTGTKATPVWVSLGSVIVTTRGDVIIGNSGGNAVRLAVGDDEQVLTADGTDVAWESIAAKIQNAQYIAGTSGGSADAYTLALVPPIAGYVENQLFVVKIHAANTTASVIDVDGNGDKDIFDNRTRAALVGGEMETDSAYLFYYDGAQFLLLNAEPVEAVVRVIDRDMSANEIVNTNSETTLYSYSVPAGMLGTNKTLRVAIRGDYLNNSGGTKIFTLKVKYGSTTLFEGTSNTMGASSNRRAFAIDFLLSAVNSDAVQQLDGSILFSPSTAPTAGYGAIRDLAGVASGEFGGNAVEDSTGALTLDITITFSTAASTLSFRAKQRMIELLP